MENKTEHTTENDRENMIDNTTEVPKKRGKFERIAAWIGIILLIALYITTLISAILATPATAALFKVSVFASALIPLMIFGYIKLVKLLTGR